MQSRALMRVELGYVPDVSVVFEAVAEEPWAMLLDSGRPHGRAGRYDIVVAAPRTTLVCRDDVTEVDDGAEQRRYADDPLEVLAVELGRFVAAPAPDLPFSGGVVGYFAYDLARRLDAPPLAAKPNEGAPDLALGLYDWALVVDHVERRTWLVGQDFDASSRTRFEAYRERFGAPPRARSRKRLALRSPLYSSHDRGAYARAFGRVRAHLQAGDCYQVNLAQRFAAAVTGDGWEGYTRLRRLHPVPHGAYLNVPGSTVLSTSPERFLRVRGARVETRPIKGTRPRGADAPTDAALRADLAASPKDRAENLMIVDLMRNDLGRCCTPGSIRVPELFAVESTRAVHHLVSAVTGELASGQTSLDLLRACFPGGSITGAPKRRAMQILDALEPHRRGVYCGAIGYVGFDGDMDTSIAIRTLVLEGGEVRFWAGGGIVADSELEAEYQETFDKAAAMLRLFDAPEASVVNAPGRVVEKGPLTREVAG